MRTLFNQLSEACAKFYIQSEHLDVDEIMLFKGRVIFKQYLHKKHKHLGVNIYKLCDMTRSTYYMRIYLGKNKQNATQMMTAAYATVRSLTRRAKWVNHELYMDSFFSCPYIFDDLHTSGINCFGTVRQNHKRMLGGGGGFVFKKKKKI
jgi:hypothetical protein